MTIKKFNYLKEGTTEKKAYELLVLNHSDTNDYGIALNYLTDEEKVIILELQQKYEEGLKPFMKAYRNFKVAGETRDEQ